MMDFTDPVLLARMQFAFTIGFHIIFPAFTIGLASFLAVLNGMHRLTGNQTYLDVFDYWKRIFAITFGMGVVSGIVMSYQFGTNWSVFADKTGPVLGPLMGYEVLTAFFLEAGFLGVMLFGREKVGPGLHLFATIMVAVGTFISSFWILAVNSWMQTPAGYAVNDAGQFVVTSWLEVIFNPSFPYRLAHMVLAAYLTTAFVVGAVGAWHLLKKQENPAARVMFSMAMWMAAIVAPIQIAAGDLHGLNTLEHQPRKIAAMEGHFETQRGAPLVLFGIPNSKDERIDYKIEIPKLGSLILTHSLDGEIKGLKEWAKEDRPPVGPVFWAFRIMVGIGFAMMGLGVWSLWLRYRGALHQSPWMHRAAVLMGPSGFIALLAGWTVTEVGRQPFTVYGLLRTSESSSAIDAAAVGSSLIAFIAVYFVLFGSGIFYIFREMAKTPERNEEGLPTDEPIRAAGITPAIELAVE
ncbi:MAG: cytochrome ubiquinol oxidase subunit I [Rhizobiaceae bacterium]